MKRKSNGKYLIIIREKAPQNVHTVLFDSLQKAKSAYKKAEAFWKINEGNAVQVEGDEKIVTVSGDCVASVTLEKQTTLPKSRNRA